MVSWKAVDLKGGNITDEQNSQTLLSQIPPKTGRFITDFIVCTQLA
jgi:hypothetical protein